MNAEMEMEMADAKLGVHKRGKWKHIRHMTEMHLHREKAMANNEENKPLT